MRVLVTGGNGFLGRYIVEQLIERGDQVRNLSRRTAPELADLGVENHIGDLQNPATTDAACRDMEAVFHVAGVAGIWGPWKYYYGINTLGTRNLLRSGQLAGVKRFVYTSSPSVTFDGTDQINVDESAPYPSRWLCHYPHSKALAEQEVLASNGRHDMFTCSLRPHLIWGPRDGHLVPRLVDRARRGRLRRVGDGSNLVDMIYVENAATAHLRACDALRLGSAVSGKAYFLSQGEPVGCWQWIDELLAQVDLGPVTRSISKRTAWRLGHSLEWAYRLLNLSGEPPMTRFLASQLATSHHFNISAARRDFGFVPEITTKEGMRRLSQWWDLG
ncbi:MAG: NAD-dependent epimerase/dehydratase family protein [Pirellulaceae bacterium]|nr:NAD-dependent epimerase/dehydratase family protein [Pirellulaceae bacterium]